MQGAQVRSLVGELRSMHAVWCGLKHKKEMVFLAKICKPANLCSQKKKNCFPVFTFVFCFFLMTLMLMQKQSQPGERWGVGINWEFGLDIHLCLVIQLCPTLCSLWPHGPQPTRLLCPWGFSRQEYWSGLPCPPSGNLPNPGIEPRSPALQADSLPSDLPGKPILLYLYIHILLYLKYIINKDLLYSTGNSIFPNNLNGKTIWKRIDTCLCIT